MGLKVLVANRGEIACRILKSLQEMGICSVAVYTQIDSQAPHVWLADEAVDIGRPENYGSPSALLEAACKAQATAVHPGYGFLSQDPNFAQACQDRNMVFIGPSPQAMRLLGHKSSARLLAQQLGIPTLPGAHTCQSLSEVYSAAEQLGYPLMLKAACSGGGHGLRRINQRSDVEPAFKALRRFTPPSDKSLLPDKGLLVEKYIHPARHIEVQIVSDAQQTLVIGDRDCSLQRRYQKVVEEAPAGFLHPAQRRILEDAAIRLIQAAGYTNAGTVEFLVDLQGSMYFLEVNTRLQVEHPVTEMITGLDVVALQVDIAHGGVLPLSVGIRGHAIEVRINAEDAYHGFLPSAGEILWVDWPQHPNVRIDTGIIQGSVITPHYDPLLAKMIAWAPTREQARRRLVTALQHTTLLGITTNQRFLIDVLESECFRQAKALTTTLETTVWQEPPLPSYLKQAAMEALRLSKPPAPSPVGSAAKPPGASCVFHADADVSSPWQSLGPFRMGTGG